MFQANPEFFSKGPLAGGAWGQVHAREPSACRRRSDTVDSVGQAPHYQLPSCRLMGGMRCGAMAGGEGRESERRGRRRGAHLVRVETPVRLRSGRAVRLRCASLRVTSRGWVRLVQDHTQGWVYLAKGDKLESGRRGGFGGASPPTGSGWRFRWHGPGDEQDQHGVKPILPVLGCGVVWGLGVFGGRCGAIIRRVFGGGG
jgi:hypothetical protein